MSDTAHIHEIVEYDGLWKPSALAIHGHRFDEVPRTRGKRSEHSFRSTKTVRCMR